MKVYMQSTPLRKAALRALSKTSTPDDVFYLKKQFALLEPNQHNCINLESINSVKSPFIIFLIGWEVYIRFYTCACTVVLILFEQALMKHETDAMRESQMPDFLTSLNALKYRRMNFEEFSTAALNVNQMEALDQREQHTRCAYEIFEKDGNRAIEGWEQGNCYRRIGIRTRCWSFSPCFFL